MPSRLRADHGNFTFASICLLQRIRPALLEQWLLSQWLQRIVLATGALGFAGPAYADLSLDDGGDLCQPENRPLLRRYNHGRFAA
jgi:hypothetical protein